MTPRDDTPQGRMGRGLVYGGMAARMGGTYLKYAAQKPFFSMDGKTQAKRTMNEKNAEVLFGGLSRLKGTALKIAQLLSLELDIFPPEIRAQLEKSYTDVPPMNRAMARKVLINAYGTRPEKIFESFESTAFAAASLGQVHRAVDFEGNALALKIQYPSIRQTIHDDIRLLRGLLRPFAEYRTLEPTIEEIETRFMEETDYLAEAANIRFFRNNLILDAITVPHVFEDLCTDRVLCMSIMEGQTLNHWLASNPSQDDRDTVARRLNRIFLKSLYELDCIHADPNPGNFIIGNDLTIGLVDYGCIKRFTHEFVLIYKKLPQIIIRGDKAAYFDALRGMQIVDKELSPAVEEAIFECAYAVGKWLGRLYESEFFDFGAESGFISEGKETMRAMLKQRRHFTMNPDLIFLDRTRYGLLRIFEQLKCRISLRNPYENDD
ncbi:MULTISPECIES: AarF/ABC1/UbiB kinase family protein [unclassified Pseudodesulfovibrio]|uniref:ABC1 kinase family protein n=1 Tax=unclassified Pseudodesulfovibrio TaxID=2661612 RepID=UPI000FEB89CB|nr:MULTISPECIES: AarF/ABC1/UbiB kinase family protein [unclassified Pseudodesulfovibrio]MCJ2164210.1 AarF/ABC1/UbiB kinase family protein [Pseudodesulfovibrio sp. S3-i]RWU05166.1 AarF/ABC1/UbiB kinase family protein [Pseudodesulfovibrio sp. S3]